jgi:sec-independent protein translocase protein TatC
VRVRLPEGATLIAIEVASRFLVPFNATFYAAVFIAMPFVLYQVWMFIEPGLYRSEKRIGVPLMASSILLFYAGVAFAYLLVIKLAFGFFISATPEGVTNAPDIGRYLSFVLSLFLAFGVAFQVPIVTFVLAWSSLVKLETLRAVRPYVFLGAFVVGMLLTPQDPLSQSFLAVPIYILYEGGLLLSRILLPEQLEEVVVK